MDVRDVLRNGRVYRFREMVALSVTDNRGNNVQCYLTANTAQALAKALQAAAKDVGSCVFTKSTLETIEINQDHLTGGGS